MTEPIDFDQAAQKARAAKRGKGRPPGKKLDPNDFPSEAQITDFWAYPPQNACIYTPTGDLWPSAYVDKRMPNVSGVRPSKWLARNREVQQMTWFPGEDQIIRDRVVDKVGWRPHDGAAIFNLYKAPPPPTGKAKGAQRWIDHVGLIYPDTADHLIRFLAFKVQFPAVKINHGLFLGGLSGVGKDTLLDPALFAVGRWNTRVVSPNAILETFNPWLQAVFLIVSEVRDLGEFNRYQLHERMKLYLAAPPDTLPINDKNVKTFYIPNVVAPIYTSNHLDVMPLTGDDRRHHCNWSDLNKRSFPPEYFDKVWGYLDHGGREDVAAYLAALNVSDWRPKAPPPQTEAFWQMVASAGTGENSEIRDVLDRLGKPPVVHLEMMIEAAEPEFRMWLMDRRNRKFIPKRLWECSYEKLHNPDAPAEGDFKFKTGRRVCYKRQDISRSDALRNVKALIG
jgi:hypothetical protein